MIQAMVTKAGGLLPLFLGAGFSISLLLPLGGQASMQEGEPNAVVVALLVFSGREDPTWTITDPERQQLPGFLAELPFVSAPNWPQFGCRGFQLFNPDPSLDFPPLVRVFRGVIEIGDSYFADVHGLEEFLRRTIPNDLDADLCPGLEE
jgi:hypothetical protein